ncbi:hypothetical protein [Frigoriglobus tundricola]|nr:hypothetical protein [Frigoriglobus tundricola]
MDRKWEFEIFASDALKKGGKVWLGEELLKQTKWLDKIGNWLREELRRYPDKGTEIFSEWFDCSKKEAEALRAMFFVNPDAVAKRYLRTVIEALLKKLHDENVDGARLNLSLESGATATVTFKGVETEYTVPGHAGLVGEVFYSNQTTQTIFQKFVSHPFWQYSHRSR